MKDTKPWPRKPGLATVLQLFLLCACTALSQEGPGLQQSLLEAARAVSEGAATETQLKLLYVNRREVSNLRFNEHMPQAHFDAAEGFIEGKIDSFIDQSIKSRPDLSVGAQQSSSKGINPYRDTDRILHRSDGEVSYKDVVETREAINRNMREWVESGPRGDDAASRHLQESLKRVDRNNLSKTVEVDAMPEAGSREFKESANYLNRQGGVLYEDHIPVQVEQRLRARKSGAPAAETRIHVEEAGAYINEMRRQVRHQGPGNEGYIESARQGKYLMRTDQVTTTIATDAGTGVQGAGTSFDRSIQKSAIRRPDHVYEANQVGAVNQYLMEHQAKRFSQTVMEMQAQNSISATEAQRAIAASMKDATPASQQRVIELYERRFGVESTKGLNRELRGVNSPAAEVSPSGTGGWLGPLPATAGPTRQLVNAAGEMGLKVVGAAGAAYGVYHIGTTAHAGYSEYQTATDAAGEDRGLQKMQEAAGETAAFGVVAVVAQTVPVVAGPALVGAGAYGLTRVGLEKTETGRKIDRKAGEVAKDLTGVAQYEERDQLREQSVDGQVARDLLARGADSKEVGLALQQKMDGDSTSWKQLIQDHKGVGTGLDRTQNELPSDDSAPMDVGGMIQQGAETISRVTTPVTAPVNEAVTAAMAPVAERDIKSHLREQRKEQSRITHALYEGMVERGVPEAEAWQAIQDYRAGNKETLNEIRHRLKEQERQAAAEAEAVEAQSTRPENTEPSVQQEAAVDEAPPVATEVSPVEDVPLKHAEGANVDVDISGLGVSEAALDSFVGEAEQRRHEEVMEEFTLLQAQLELVKIAEKAETEKSKAGEMRECGAGEAQEIRDQSAQDTAATERETSMGKILGDALESSITALVTSAGESFGAGVAEQVAHDLFDENDARDVVVDTTDSETVSGPSDHIDKNWGLGFTPPPHLKTAPPPPAQQKPAKPLKPPSSEVVAIGHVNPMDAPPPSDKEVIEVENDGGYVTSSGNGGMSGSFSGM